MRRRTARWARWHRAVLAAAVALILVGAGAADVLAQRRGEAAEDKRAVAERFFRAGEQAYNAGQYLVAAQAFEESYALVPLPAIAFSTAQAYRLQYFIDKEPGRLIRAVELYRLYIEQVPRGGRREDATTSLSELEPIRIRLEAQGKLRGYRRNTFSGTQLMVTSPVANARASIDGESGEVPLIRDVQPGKHEVEVSADGYFPVTQQATAVAGRFIVVEVGLKPKPGKLQVQTEDGAAISVDGRPAGATPLSRPLAVRAGKHFITISRRGRQPWSREVEIARGETRALRARLETTGQRQGSYWVLGTAGVAAAAAGASAGIAIYTDRELATLEEKRATESLTLAELDRRNQLEDRRATQTRLGYAFLGVSLAAALTGGLLYWFDTPRLSADSVPAGSTGALSWSATPMLGGAQGTGFAVAGSF